MAVCGQHHRVNLDDALNKAIDFLPKAAGCTEKFQVLNNLGAIYYLMGKYRLSLSNWLEALPHAEVLMETWSESKPLLDVTSNLVLAYTQLKDFSSLGKLLGTIRTRFDKELPSKFKASISYSRSLAALNIQDFETFKEQMFQHLEHSKHTNDHRALAIAMHNVAVMYERVGELEQAVSAYEEVIGRMMGHDDLKGSNYIFIAQKNYAKTLAKLGRTEEFTALVSKLRSELDRQNLPDTKARVLLVQAYYGNEMECAEEVLHSEGLDIVLKKCAVKILLNYCSNSGDEAGLMKYYKIGDEIGLSPKNEVEDLI